MRIAALLALWLIAACGPAYRERPTSDPRRGEPGTTVVGTVSPEGEVRADTLAGAVPDTARVDRETVVTGAIVADPDEPADRYEPGRTEPAAGNRPAAGPWQVQVFAAREEASAREVARGVEARIEAPARVERDGGWYKVRVGGYADRAQAEALRRRLAGMGFSEAFLVRASGT
jgi:cell division protein FtsN